MIYLSFLRFIFSLVLILNICSLIKSEGFFSSIGGEHGLGFAYEFKIHLNAGKEDCYYQEIEAHTNLYIAFQVIKGGDAKAGFGIRDPYGNVLLPYKWQESAEYEVESVPQSGVYQFCIDNSLSRFQDKLISLYCSSYKRDEWEKLVEKLKDSDSNLLNITSSLSNVDKNIGSMLKTLDHSRRNKLHDYLLLESNFNYIHNLSITYIIIILFCGFGQIYFLKKMFNSNNEKSSSSSYKPTA